LLGLNSLLCVSARRGAARKENTRTRRRAGTTLIEVLVVIVIFAVGILAVIQVFPRGLGVLVQARNKTVAQQLARDESERLKARPDQLPEQIVAIRQVGTTTIIDADRSSTDLGPTGNQLSQTGVLRWGGNLVGNWAQNSGANVFRRILGEGRQVPAASWVGNFYGGLMTLQFAPIDITSPEPVTVYGRDLLRRIGDVDPQARREGHEYFVTNVGTPQVALRLPIGPTPRRFRIAFTGYVKKGAATFEPRQYVVNYPPTSYLAAGGTDLYGNYGLADVALADLPTDGSQLYGVEMDSIRVSRLFTRVTPAEGFSKANNQEIDPYEFMLLDPSLGVLLFSPAASSEREPVLARVDYDVKDWRIIRDEFRVSDGDRPQHRLALQSLKVGGSAGPDGRPNEAIFLDRTNTNMARVNDSKADHFILEDMNTGGMVAERSWNGGRQLVAVDKSLGLITFNDANPATPEIDAEILLPMAARTTVVPLANRPLRALYMANGEWSVQVMKAASNYTVTYSKPGPGEYYVGGTGMVNGLRGLPARIYFSPADAGRRVTIDELFYFDANREMGQLLGQDFQIQYRRLDPIGLPSIDISEVIPGARFLDGQGRMRNGYAARGVKGASIAVRVLNNPATFSLTNNSATNMRRLEEWGRNWKRSTTETYIQRGEIR
jgi:Tfp pilus assembly protein PilV